MTTFWNKVNACGTVIAAIAAVIAAGWAWGQYSVADQLRTIAQQDLNSKRAFVFFDKFTENFYIHQRTKELLALGLSPQWQNSGETPAKKLRISSGVYTCSKEGIFPFEYIQDEFFNYDGFDKGNSTPIVLGPKNTQTNNEWVIGDSTVRAIKGQTRNAYWVGWARYLDDFGVPHETRVCLEIKSNQPNTGNSLRYEACPYFNCVDKEDCSEKLTIKHPQQWQTCKLANT